MTVIVNADDYSYDERKTRAIVECFERNILTSTTATTNTSTFEPAMKTARDKGFLKEVGLHFNIADGFPLTEEMQHCRVLCDESGRFSPGWHRHLKTRLFLPQAARRAIAAEATAQMTKFLDCGGTLMHLDSHYHTHTDFSVATILFPLAQKFGFKTVRLSRTIGVSGGVMKRFYKTAFNIYARHALGVGTDEFTDFNAFQATYEQLPKNAVVEVMVHPEYTRKLFEGKPIMHDMGRSLSGDDVFWDNLRKSGVKMIGYSEA